jgi:hypothetical protein
MSAHRTGFRVQEMCRVFEVSRSGYYRWIKRQPSRRELDNRALDAQIGQIHAGSKGRWQSEDHPGASRQRPAGLQEPGGAADASLRASFQGPA